MGLTQKQTIRSSVLAALAMAMLSPASAFAQLNGDHILGWQGVDGGTQAPPGFYVGSFYYRYRTDTIKNANGTKLVIDPSQPASATLPFVAPTFVYVSKMKILGGNYGAFVAPGVALGNTLEAPGFGFGASTPSGLSDTYFAPFMLGWHLARADINTAFSVYAPTGKYTPGSSDNTGRGMWAYEPSAGATVYLDAAKTWTAATVGYFETNGKKEGTAVTSGDQIALGGAKVGNLLTLEGGVGRQFAKGAAHAGLAYYAQWKLTNDDFSSTPPSGPILSKARVFALGPDATVPIATKTAMIAFVNVRYFWEAGAEVKTQGQTLIVSASFPVPSMKISPTQ